MSKPIDQERELFEAHVKREHEEPNLTVRSDGTYKNFYLQCAWEGWQARAAVQPAGGAVPDALADAVRVLLEVPQLQGEQAYSAQPIIDRVRAMLADAPHPVSGEQKAERWFAACGDHRDTLIAIHGEQTGHIVSGIPESQAHDLIKAHNGGLPESAHRAQQGEQTS